jgi:hypothetical protein
VVLALFAVFIAVAGIGFAIRFTAVAGSTSADRAPMAVAPDAPQPASGANLRILATGHDYTPAELNAGAESVKSLAASGAAVPGPLGTAQGGSTFNYDSAYGSLSRLAAPSQLDACLSSLTRIHPGRPDVVDFATFDRHPALIVHLANPAGIVVVGPACGVEGPDILFTAPSR